MSRCELPMEGLSGSAFALSACLILLRFLLLQLRLGAPLPRAGPPPTALRRQHDSVAARRASHSWYPVITAGDLI